jgi:hypothetical protein
LSADEVGYSKPFYNKDKSDFYDKKIRFIATSIGEEPT